MGKELSDLLTFLGISLVSLTSITIGIIYGVEKSMELIGKYGKRKKDKDYRDSEVSKYMMK